MKHNHIGSLCATDECFIQKGYMNILCRGGTEHSVCMYTLTCIYMYICIYVCTYVFIYIYIQSYKVKSFILQFYFFIFLCMCAYVHLTAGVEGGQKSMSAHLKL